MARNLEVADKSAAVADILVQWVVRRTAAEATGPEWASVNLVATAGKKFAKAVSTGVLATVKGPATAVARFELVVASAALAAALVG